MQSMFRIFLLAGMFALTATVSRGESEIVVAIRYLQAKGTSHSHLYLYRENGKLLRQLTNDNSGQDVDPIFVPDGETIVFTREKPNDTREFCSIDPRGTKLKKLDAAPDWYSATKSSPYFTSLQQGEDKEDPLDWVIWFRDSKSAQEAKVGKLRGFPSFEPMQIRRDTGGQFLFEGPLRLIFFSCHLDSSNGDTVEAFDFSKRKLVQLSPNWATPIPLPGEAAFLTLTENRYVEIPGSSKTANCSYIERWGPNMKEKCYEEHEPPYCEGEPEVRYARKNSAAICYGASMYRLGKDPAVITIRSGSD